MYHRVSLCVDVFHVCLLESTRIILPQAEPAVFRLFSPPSWPLLRAEGEGEATGAK